MKIPGRKNWEVEDDWEDDDFVDIDLDSGRTSDEDPDDIFERPERPGYAR